MVNLDLGAHTVLKPCDRSAESFLIKFIVNLIVYVFIHNYITLYVYVKCDIGTRHGCSVLTLYVYLGLISIFFPNRK